LVFRADATRIFGTHWNLNGYWRGTLQSGSTPSQPTLQDLVNRTYLMSLTYINPASNWTRASAASIFLAGSLETIDGAMWPESCPQILSLGFFGGSTPDPTSWNYNPMERLRAF